MAGGDNLHRTIPGMWAQDQVVPTGEFDLEPRKECRHVTRGQNIDDCGGAITTQSLS